MYRYKANVIKVVDGDTIDLEIELGFNILIRERVRLYGIDAPETRTKDKKEKAKGLKTKRYVENAIGGEEIEIETKKDKGKFGRYLATIHYDRGDGISTNLNAELITSNLAKEYYGGKR